MPRILLLNIFPLLIFNALEITGFYTITWYKQAEENEHTPDEKSKMALWWVKYYSLKVFGEFWSKPFCTCPPCMSSLHSLWFWLFFPFNAQFLVLYIFYVFSLCGLMKLITLKFD